MSKIIELGVCIDNNDPKGLGRIRVIDFDDYVAGKENVREYVKWSKDDPFIALPFLPNNINFIPEIRQAVKILRYDSEKSTVNQEYIAGPFTTRYDFNSETFSQQISQTSYGVAVLDKEDIVKTEDGTLPPNALNALSKYKDYSVNGKYGSDMILTEGGIVLRGGKLLSKDIATENEKLQIAKNLPLVSKKVAKLQLKKFGGKKIVKPEIIENTIVDVKNLRYIIEYSVDDLDTPTTVDFFVYQVQDQYGAKYSSGSFTEFTETVGNEVKILNIDSLSTTPTFSVNLLDLPDFSESTLSQKINDIGSTIRIKIAEIQANGFDNVIPFEVLSLLNISTTDIYPFFFRPTFEFKDRDATTQQESVKQNILNKVKSPSNGSVSAGLIFSQTRVRPTSRKVSEVVNTIKTDNTSREQTFGSIVSDKLYFLSTDTNFTDKRIDFETLDTYEYTQDDYLTRIDPNTYSVVRGEVLLEFIRAMYDVLTTHVHNINKPYVKKDYDPHENLEKLFFKLENELLNKSVRIN